MVSIRGCSSDLYLLRTAWTGSPWLGQGNREALTYTPLPLPKLCQWLPGVRTQYILSSAALEATLFFSLGVLNILTWQIEWLLKNLLDRLLEERTDEVHMIVTPIGPGGLGYSWVMG